MSVDEYTNKFVKLLQYVRQEYDMDKKKVKRYTQRLHSKYSSLILATKTHNFHYIIDAVRKMEARAITKQSSIPKATDVSRFDHLTKTVPSSETKKDKGGNFCKKQKKNKFSKRIKSSLRIEGRFISGSDTSDCVKCEKPHQRIYMFGTSQCYRCGQERHMSRECPNMERVVSQ
ncbi:hypothetical protein P3X46_004788 [Hevea brasiliensis]|uniref:CCHC-type domain-containing protein n=1 Tax=Hevea brasiliensis TaxID=3981 RepID=A0ABQ9N1P5_HEVBR|nr:hypothetical protein P3X46_004788 [Hevea brasiliensis]